MRLRARALICPPCSQGNRDKTSRSETFTYRESLASYSQIASYKRNVITLSGNLARHLRRCKNARASSISPSSSTSPLKLSTF